jgi:hypothetical protein
VRVAFIKQLLDVHGPWSTVLWENTTPRKLLDVWPGKATFWEMTCCLKADWYVIPQQLSSDYTKNVLSYPGRGEMISRYTRDIIAPEKIPIEQYDVVITHDPILAVPADSPTLFVYFVVEHWDCLYNQSLRGPLGRYDLFLAHMMDGPKSLASLPQVLAFPYLRDPDAARVVFPANKVDAVWADFRTLTTLGMAETYGMWVASGHAAAKRLEETLSLPVCYKASFNENPYGISDPPAWGDAANYFNAMARCKYYVAVGTIAGAGQAICDAASLGCLCIGQQEKAFHRLICHPAALCDHMMELPRRLRAIAASPDLQEEVRAWQDAALRDFFQRRPLALLEEAISMKRSSLAAREPCGLNGEPFPQRREAGAR